MVVTIQPSSKKFLAATLELLVPKLMILITETRPVLIMYYKHIQVANLS